MRKPAIASLVGLLFVSMLVGTIVSSYFAIEANTKASNLTVALHDADQQREIAKDNAAKAIASELATEKLLYRSNMYLAGQAFNARRFSRVMQLLNRHLPAEGKPDNRGFIWHCLWSLCHMPAYEFDQLGHRLRSVKVSPDGKFLASAAMENRIPPDFNEHQETSRWLVSARYEYRTDHMFRLVSRQSTYCDRP